MCFLNINAKAFNVVEVILKKAVSSTFLAQALDAPGKLKKRLITNAYHQ